MRQPGEQVDELGPAGLERLRLQVAVAAGEQVEGDEHGRRRLGEHVHTGCRGVDPLRERVPVQTLRARLALGDDDLAVEQTGLGQEP